MTTERQAIAEIMQYLLKQAERQNRSIPQFHKILDEWNGTAAEAQLPVCPACGGKQIEVVVTRGVHRYMCSDEKCRHVFGRIEE